MPEMDGIETVREILAIDPEAVIFTMSGADEDYQEVARMVGARRGFRKPINTAGLLEAFGVAADRSRHDSSTPGNRITHG